MCFLNKLVSKGLITDTIEAKLINLGSLEGRKSAWIRSDLEVVKSNCVSRIFWTLFAKHFEWARKLFFCIDLEESKRQLDKIRLSIIPLNDKKLESLYEVAAAKFNLIASNHRVDFINARQELKENVGMGKESIKIPAKADSIPLPIPEKKESLDAMANRLFNQLERETEALTDAIETLPHNYREHRFENVFCPINTAIEYDKSESENETFYIHANRVESPKGKTFIAAQVNLQHNKFWKAVLLHTDIIIDLTSGGEIKAYYPPVNETLTEKDVSIFCSKQENVDDKFIISTYTVSKEGQSKEIKRIHYIAWADFNAAGVEDVLKLIALVDQQMTKESVPMVHCRAGVGRTGTFITAYNLMHRKKENSFEGEKTLKELILAGRIARGPLYVQSKVQLRLLLEIASQG